MWTASRDPGPSGGSRPDRGATWLVAACACALLLAPRLDAQERPRLGDDGRGRTRAVAPVGRLNVELGVASLYDTNIEHREDGVAAFGVVTSGDLQYRSRWRELSYWLEGGLALHSYTATERYDRLSKVASARAELPLARALRAGMLVQLALAGTSEDRVVNDQLAISPRVVHTFGAGGLARLYAALRFRRSQDGEHMGTNRYLALYLRSADGDRPYADLTARYEVNRPDLDVNRFDRWLGEIGYSVPVDDATRLGLDLQVSTRRYDRRPLDEELDAPPGTVRRDVRWSPGITLTREISDLTLGLEYEFDTRTSNDPDKSFRSHSLRLETAYRW
jgi:hypothetical protein